MPTSIVSSITGKGSVPAGGGAGQVLSKASATDYDLSWAAAPAATQVSHASAVASDYLARIKLAADTQYRAQLGLSSGSVAALLLGAGGATAPDVNLYRSAANVLKTDDAFEALSLTVSGAGSFLSTPEFRLRGSGPLDGVDKMTAGTSFPASPSTNHMHFHTTNKMWFVWDGTYWVCACRHTLQLSMIVTTTLPLSATATDRFAASFPLVAGLDLLIDGWDCLFYVASGGTALGASHKWVGTVKRQNDNTTISTLTIDSGGSAAWRSEQDAADDYIDATSNYTGVTVTWTKTGTPGTLAQVITMSYRYIGV